MVGVANRRGRDCKPLVSASAVVRSVSQSRGYPTDWDSDGQSCGCKASAASSTAGKRMRMSQSDVILSMLDVSYRVVVGGAMKDTAGKRKIKVGVGVKD